MADTVLASQDNSGLRKAVASVVASMVPARGPRSGSLGYSASAYTITYDRNCATEEKVVTSPLPNSTVWRAIIEAIIIILRFSGPKTHLTIYVTSTSIASCYNNRWINANGDYGEDFQVAREIYSICEDKDIKLLIIYKQADRYVKNLKLRARAAAEQSDALLTPIERKAVLVAKGAQPFNQSGGFPPVGEYDEVCAVG